MNNLLVMKFGGTSVGNSTRIAASCALIAKAAAVRPVVAVVSAMSKVTDLLLDTTKHAEAGDRPVLDRNIETLRNRHLETARDLLSGSELQDVEAAIATRRLGMALAPLWPSAVKGDGGPRV